MRGGTPSTEDFGQRLRFLRARAGLSQEALSHAAGVSVRALADLERGRTRGPQRRTVEALAEALGLDRDEASGLEASAALGRPRPRTAEGPAVTVPLALPRDIQDFTARDAALARLLDLARDAGPNRPVVSVVTGQPGLGKTAFAVHAAHRLAPHFPDGQLVLDLHGMDAEPTTPRDALARLLGAMGIADAAIPAGTDDRASLWRSLAAGRRLLLLLDNAIDESQVGLLLPGTGPSLTIVTSRQALAGLTSVHRCDLALLRREEAVELLTRIIGPERVRAEAQAARDLADLCAGQEASDRQSGGMGAGEPQLIAVLHRDLGGVDLGFGDDDPAPAAHPGAEHQRAVAAAALGFAAAALAYLVAPVGARRAQDPAIVRPGETVCALSAQLRVPLPALAGGGAGATRPVRAGAGLPRRRLGFLTRS
ncbi:helix-turn-helix domain-containing protein [Streptomyces sp. R39]|uniref:Helix-turn-helix domain-containing protein n=1 Tax=Streptomyces sp. R39 TaxID=3238631 RepID=A0AB39R406_9ACTN